MAVAVHGLVAMEGETAFAFFVVRTHEPITRSAVLELLRYLAPLIPDPDTFLEEVAEDLEQDVQLLALPWLPPEAGHAVEGQRRLIESAGTLGVEAAWFFQTGTSLPVEAEDDEDEEDDDEDDEDDVRSARAMTTDDSWAGESTWSIETGWSSGELGGDTKTTPIEIIDMSTRDDDLDDDEGDLAGEEGDEDETWSHGPPPQVTATRFPVDGYPAILEELDWEDFGVAVKLRGSMLPGEGTLLFGFHTLWLAPYGGRHRNAAVTIDRRHHAAHFWVDRFAVPCPVPLQVHHLLWILTKLDQVVPIVHARFAGATPAQKYAELVDEPGEPFVLGGNPLLAVYAEAGEQGVDRWIAAQTEWSPEEVAQMLRELAIEVVTARDEEDEGDDDDDDDGRGEDEEDDDEEDEDDDDDDDEAEGSEDEDRGRHITHHASELLAARATAGLLDARVAPRLLPLLARTDRDDDRRCAAVQILGALRYRPAVPGLIQILDETITSSPDTPGKDDLIAATATALGAIGDPAAIDALVRVVTAAGSHNDRPRPVAAEALASCLAAAPEPRHVDDGVLAGLLTTIGERNDGWLNAESQLAYGRLAQQLPPDRRALARQRLADAETARDDAIAMLARQAALVLASPATPSEPPPRGLGALLHDSLTSLAYDHEDTVHNLRIALRVAAVVPELVDPDDLVWLTRFTEPEIRDAAHVLLVQLGAPLARAAVFDPLSARELDDDALVRAIGEPHVVGRAALIGEAGRRGLAGARRAIVDACHDVISRARQGGENLLDPDVRVLEAAVPLLREPPLDDDAVALFDRMLRHSNYHVKWELLQAPPRDERLVGGMFHVLGEKWGWQEKTARAWLAVFEGTPAYEFERKLARHGTDDVTAGDDSLADDEDMN